DKMGKDRSAVFVLTQHHTQQMTRRLLLILVLGQRRTVNVSFTDFPPLQQSLFVEAVHGGHHRGKSQTSRAFGMELADTDPAALPHLFHQSGLQGAKLPKRLSGSAKLPFKPHFPVSSSETAVAHSKTADTYSETADATSETADTYADPYSGTK